MKNALCFFIIFVSEFEKIALDVIQMCYETNQKDAKLLLMREIPQFGNLTCLQIAKIAQDISFMSHPCVQESLSTIWYSKILPDTGYIKVEYTQTKFEIFYLKT